MKMIGHSLVLIGSFGIAILWANTPLVSYTIQALGAIVCVYFVISFIRRKRNPTSELFSTTSDIFMLNTAILLLITITGNLYSPLFFLLYFLGFGITFIFEPATVFVFTLGTLLLFLPEATKNGSIESYVRLGSVALISPLAFFFGQEYRDRDVIEADVTAMQERAHEEGSTIAKDVKEVIEHEKDTLKPEDIEKLNEVLEEAQDLREETNA